MNRRVLRIWGRSPPSNGPNFCEILRYAGVIALVCIPHTKHSHIDIEYSSCRQLRLSCFENDITFYRSSARCDWFNVTLSRESSGSSVSTISHSVLLYSVPTSLSALLAYIYATVYLSVVTIRNRSNSLLR